MSVWVRALCTKPLGDLAPGDLRAGIAERLPLLSALYGEDDHEAALARLRIEGEPPLGVWEIAYREGDGFLRVERWKDRAEVEEEVGELMETLEDSDEDGVDDVRALCERVVETVGIELKISDCEGIGWPVAIAAAAFFATRGEGIVQADGEGWMLPRGREVEHVLDGD
jgi:hypothetical protein